MKFLFIDSKKSVENGLKVFYSHEDHNQHVYKYKSHNEDTILHQPIYDRSSGTGRSEI